MENKQEQTKVLLIENGPIAISGSLQITGQYGEKEVEGTTVYLCRCGESKNKPYCDGSHKAGFQG